MPGSFSPVAVFVQRLAVGLLAIAVARQLSRSICLTGNIHWLPCYTIYMTQPTANALNRHIVRKISLEDEGLDDGYSNFTAEERVLMVWPITLTAWKFKEPNGFESRLQRHVARIERR